MNIEYDLKEHLDKEFKNLNENMNNRFENVNGRFENINDRLENLDRRLEKLETEMKEHRKEEERIKIDLNVLKSQLKWLLCILSPIGTAILVGVVKVVFFN